MNPELPLAGVTREKHLPRWHDINRDILCSLLKITVILVNSLSVHQQRNRGWKIVVGKLIPHLGVWYSEACRICSSPTNPCSLQEKCGVPDTDIFKMLYVLTRASQVVLVVKNPPANAGRLRRVPSLGGWRSPGGGHGNPLQYSFLGNPMDREAWQAAVTWLKWLSMQYTHMCWHRELCVRGKSELLNNMYSIVHFGGRDGWDMQMKV